MAPASQPVSNPPVSASAPARKKRNRFTPQMAGRQARGKDPLTGDAPLPAGHQDETAVDGTERVDGKPAKAGVDKVDEKGRAKIDYTGDSYEAKERREWASTILNSMELLMMFAQSRGDTIPSTRHYLTLTMCGIEDTRKPLRRREKKAADPDNGEEVLVQTADTLDLSGR